MNAPLLDPSRYGLFQGRLTTETAVPVRREPERRFDVESPSEYIGRYYRDFLYTSDVRGPLAAIRDALARHGSLRFSEHYPDPVIPLVEETVAWEMLLCDYFPGEQDRIEFGVIDLFPEDQLHLMFATGLTDTGGISHPRVFVREDILRASASDPGPSWKGFDTYAEEIRHGVEALWRNRVGYLTSGQQAMLNRGRLTIPADWPEPASRDASFVTQILGESSAHLMDYARYGHDRYGKGSDYNRDYYVDLVVRHPSITLCQTDAHRPAQALDRLIRKRIDLWTPRGRLLPLLARRIHQYFILSNPRRQRRLSESTLRCWQDLHDLPYAVGGLFHTGLEPPRLRGEVVRAAFLMRKLYNGLLSDGVRMEDERVYRDTLEVLGRISEELRSVEGSLDTAYVLRVKQSMWRLLHLFGKALNQGSALRAVAEEIDGLQDLPSFYGALLRKVQDAAKNALLKRPSDWDTRILLHGLIRRITSEARALNPDPAKHLAA